MRTLIFSYLYHRPGSPLPPSAALQETLDIWLDHLRGPGCYRGDVLLFSNVQNMQRQELQVQPFENVPANDRRAHLHRALSCRDVPVRDYDVAMQMDLDLLAVNDINPLFPRDTRLWAAPSDAPTLDWRHAWTLLLRWRRGIHKLVKWRLHELASRRASSRPNRDLGAELWRVGPADPRSRRSSDSAAVGLELSESALPETPRADESVPGVDSPP